MKRSILFALLAVFLFHTMSSHASQQAAKAKIEGVVVRLGTGEPVPRARVTLTQGRGAVPASAAAPAQPQRGAAVQPKTIPAVVTDDLGRFTFQELDEGSFTLQILANGYVSLNYGQRYTGGPGTPIALTAGQDLKNLAISLTPAGNISGRITDRSDQPLANVPMQLMRYSYDSQGQRSYQSVGTAKTDDRGEYRIYWVTPGRYFLLAGSPGIGANPLLALLTMIEGGDSTSANAVPVPLGYAFYPGVSDIGSARTIDLRPGSDLDSVNLTLTSRPPTYRIRGRVIDSRTGQPPPRASVWASSRAAGVGNSQALEEISRELPINNYNSSTGAFEIRDLLPGSYLVMANAQDPPAPAAGRGVAVQPPVASTGSILTTVADANVDGVLVTTAPAASVSGRVRTDNSQQVGVTPDRVRVQLISRNPTSSNLAGSYGTVTASPAADGAFRFVNVALGDYRLGFQALGGARGTPGGGTAYLKEARLDGADVLNAPLRISGSMAGTLDIVLGATSSQLSGIVSDQKSQPVSVVQVVLIPDRTRERIDLYRIATTDINGRFSLFGVIPGDYRVFSWDGLEPNGWFDPDLQAQSATGGTAVHVTDTSTEMIEVKMIPKEVGR